jgi:cation transport ATPase
VDGAAAGRHRPTLRRSIVGIPLPLGGVGHEGSTIIVVMNGLRLLRTPRR